MRISVIMALSGIILSVFLTSIAEAGRIAGRRSLSNTKWGYLIVKEPVRAGRVSQRFEVRAGDCGKDEGWSDCETNRERSEFTINKKWKFGTDQWIGFSVFLPKDFKTSSRVRSTVGQIHQRGGPTGTAGGLPSFPPLMQMEMKGNSYFLGVHILSGSATNVRDTTKEFSLARISDMRGRWTDLLIHLDTSSEKPILEVYVNGKRKAIIENWIKFRPKEYYFKYGIYRSFVSKHGGPMPTQILYIDEVRMGRSAGRVVVNEKRPVD